ncbi:hypothetical protein DFR58_12736 [Anaerobacterium chartisolvens]|uniref:Uncharacterized protein n=1 Tax=Anaerobacterium chartisolvens TaxID=1297424 RepID=A0A369AP72_9FIRM|nr:hypothetical protein [Anaerobacterium chartisolvens]RCX11160.1 hypothetical protein DFR58_12736 [Anaerobacterium chartisolvens]
MEFKLMLFKGTDSIKFGMTSLEIQVLLNTAPILFKKTEFDIYETEEYNEICHVFYERGQNNSLVCAAFEFFRPSQVFLEGIPLIGEKTHKAEDLFKTMFDDCISDSSGSSSKKYGISFYSSDKKVESVYVARKGYCTEQEEYYKEAFDEKYSSGEDLKDPTVRKRLCPSCMDIIDAKEGTLCPKCNVLML